MYEPLIMAMASLEIDTATALVKQYIKDGALPLEIIESCRKGVDIVGKRYQNEEYFLADLVMSEAIFKEVMDLLEPYLPQLPNGKEDKASQIVIGTIEGDIHDLGKNIVAYLLRAAGYSVCDLGVEVPIAKFITYAGKPSVKVLGVCFLLTNCMNAVKTLTEALVAAGLRDKVTVIIGGYAADEATRIYVGADHCATNAANVVELFDGIFDIVR